jgi:acyl-CoA thioesterase-1
MKFPKLIVLASALIGVSLALTGLSSAQIVALGASNTQGYGVNPTEAWPAQLESMLRAEGSNAHIANAGVSGETTGQQLARLSTAVPDGTKVVILGTSTFNDRRTGINIDVARANIEMIKKQLRNRGIRIVDALGIIVSVARQPGMLQADNVHLTAEGHRRVAVQLVGAVKYSIQRMGRYTGGRPLTISYPDIPSYLNDFLLRDGLNTRSTFRFKALMTPMRANIVGPSPRCERQTAYRATQVTLNRGRPMAPASETS